MLASTMQHSTHHHTPKPTTTTTTPTHPNKGHPRDALDGPGRERPPEKTTTNRQMSSQDPTVCRNLSMTSGVMFHPATPPQHTRGVEITRRKPTTTRRRPAPPYREAP